MLKKSKIIGQVLLFCLFVLIMKSCNLWEKEFPDDILYEQQSNLKIISMSSAWKNEVTGKNVTIAVIDSGVMNHDDLDMSRITGKGYFGDEHDYQDDYGHGTIIVGLLAAERNNKKGIAGMTDSTISVRKIYRTGEAVDIQKLSDAIYEAVDDGCQVINLSIGTPNEHVELKKAIEYAVEKKVLVIAAVGSKKNTVYYPAAYENVIGVGSVRVDENGVIENLVENNAIDIVAPGNKIIGLSTYDRYERNCEGASYATPHVTAMAAFAKEVNPEIDAEQFERLLQKSSIDLGDEGYDTTYGWGFINVDNFICLLKEDR